MQNIGFPNRLIEGKAYVLTILIHDMCQDEEAPGTDAIKFPHGVLNYQLKSRSQDYIN